MKSYWSKRLDQITAYTAGEQPRDGKYIKLNTNENPYPPSARVMEKLQALTPDQLRLYPDPDAQALKDTIAAYYKLENGMVFVGNGSDEVLAHAFMAFFDQEHPVCFPDITYSFYPVYCAHFDIRYTQIPLAENFDIDINAYPEDNGGIIFPNPNAPTGKYLGVEYIRELLDRCRDSVIVIDEAYIDFGGSSCIPLVREYPNLVVTQTLSKSRSLAGLRVGFAAAQPQLIAGLELVKNSFNSYPLDSLAISGGIEAFIDQSHFEKCTGLIISTRNWLTGYLQQLGFEVIPSQANFLMARHPACPSARLYQELKARGVLVRYFNTARISDYFRVSIGAREEMEEFVAILKKILEL